MTKKESVIIGVARTNFLELIKSYLNKDDFNFKRTSHLIANSFDEVENYNIYTEVKSLFENRELKLNPQVSKFVNKMNVEKPIKLLLPNSIVKDVNGIINAINRNVGINKFLFEGLPGTGKTETAKYIAQILKNDLYIVNSEEVVDSLLGKTPKNIKLIFDEINDTPQRIILFLDEIDSLALDRVNSQDLRDMGRATSTLLKCLDNLSEKIILIATTNLYNLFDKALSRRFDYIVNFNRYDKSDLINTAEFLLNELSKKFKLVNPNAELFRKILKYPEQLPYPAEIKNILKTSIAFSNENNKDEFLKNLFSSITKNHYNLDRLAEIGFTDEEIKFLIY